MNSVNVIHQSGVDTEWRGFFFSFAQNMYSTPLRTSESERTLTCFALSWSSRSHRFFFLPFFNHTVCLSLSGLSENISSSTYFAQCAFQTSVLLMEPLWRSTFHSTTEQQSIKEQQGVKAKQWGKKVILLVLLIISGALWTAVKQGFPGTNITSVKMCYITPWRICHDPQSHASG